LHDPFEHLKHKLWSKERSRVKLPIWLPTTKSQESTRFPRGQATCNIPLKISRQGLQLCFRPHYNRRSAREIIGPQSHGNPVVGISGLPLGSPKTKCHLDVAPVENRKKYYKGEGGGFPKFGPWWILWIRICPWLILASKVFKLCTN
jgi:hypothetical protein